MSLKKSVAIIMACLSSCIGGSLSALYAQQMQGNTQQTLSLRNLKQTQEYDDKENSYSIGTKLGDNYLEIPMIMSQQEYEEWSIERSMRQYFRQKNSEIFQEEGHDKFDFTDMHFDLGPAEKIFGPGGVQVKTQGSATIKIGGDHKVVNNPAITPQNRTTGGFDFDMKFNVNVNAKVGNKIDMRLNYNTESTFDFDAKNIKLKYEGKEDEIIRLIEAGNVSFPTNSSLIHGAQSLFGIRTDLQFGKLKLQMVLSQKNSSSKTVSAKGGNQVTDFEIDVTDYDENRHFFLGHYFRDTYNDNMSMLPTIMSGVNITRIELWVTNKRSNYESPRNIVAFADLAESRHISNTDVWIPMVGATLNPKNQNNTLYTDVSQGALSAVRNIEQVAAVLGPILNNGNGDYEKISNARRLASNEYTLNPSLGYVSLNTALSADEVLAVAYEYTLNGQVYQVGEFSTDVPDADQSLVLKLLKSNSNSPGSGTWDLMMKNIYSLGSGQLSQNGFKLYVCYLNDSTGCYINYLPESDLKSVPLNQLLGLDRIDSKGNAQSDGEFDYLPGYTVQEQRGRIVFPVVEPFGAYLEEVGEESARRYVFNELYDSTRVVASRIASKNKFAITGQYSGSARNVIDLGSYNIPQGSVTVTAGGTTLIPNLDYTIDYSLGRVTIINQSIIDAGTQVNVRLESNTEFSMQRKTMAGINLIYNPAKDLNLTGTVMHMNERPLTSKVVMGNEPLVNTMLGAGIDWKHKSNGLTKVVNLLPFVNTTKPSEIRFNAEVAGLISKVSDKVQGSSSYIDDFESAEGGIDISSPSAWTLSAVPLDIEGANLTDNVETGYHRALLNWFSVDPLFTRRNSMLTPAHLKGDLDQLSNHFVREVYERELYPNKESVSSESTTLRVLNLAFYPNERGPYNLNPDLDGEGFLRRPEQNWGGIMRSITTTNFEAANIEYVEFWLMDPFVYDGPAAGGGDMFLELGEVSEDVLKDGKKFFENGLPTNGDATKYSETVWGRVPNITSLVYAFDNSEINNRKKQDVGLNGLSSEQERNFPTYSDYLAQIKPVVSPERYKDFEDDPANDNYHYFLGDDYDDLQLSILERYKRYNGTEGNSPNSEELSQKFNSSASVKPDVEDANNDYTLDEHEKYFQYHISVRPSDLEIGRNYIVDKRVVNSKLRNGNTEEVTWFRFRIPIDQYSKVVGGIRDFSSIRFARIWLKGFAQTVHLRFGTMQLRTSSWRNYEQPIANAQNQNAFLSGEMSQASVNIEINGDRRPVNYVVPPGITRILDPTQTQLVQDNEQALSLRATNLAAGQARAIYKPSNLDLRRYERLQMFAHVESLIGSAGQINDGDISVFIRLGSDYTNNYYEYEIPLKVTPAGIYSGESTADRYIVWPKENMLDIPITLLSQIKLNRPAGQNVYSEYDPDKPENRITVAGNPSTGNVRAIMIGMRNNSQNTKDAEVWVNELRLCGYESNGGMAAQSSLNIKLADVATVDMHGQMHTHGFGGLEDKVASRSLDDYYKYSVTTSGDAGRLLPAKAKVSIPVYYSYTKEQSSPQYNPFDTDVELKNSPDSVKKLASAVSEQKNFSITGAKVNIYGKKHRMPYDPANFKFDFSHSVENNKSGTIEYERQLDWRVALTYQYEPQYKSWKPFVKEQWGNALRALQVNWLPQSIQFNTDLQRNYYEIQDRDMSTIRFGGKNAIPVRFSQQYYWNRKFSMRWDLFTSLKMNISTATRAEIEEPYVVVNKAMYPDQYTMWKDSVRHSLEKLGNPLDYQQNFSASYQIPLDKFSIFSWLKSDASYSSAYAWKRGTTQKNGMNYGNTINNSRTIGANAHLNFETLYNYIPGVKNMLQEMQKIRDKRTAAAQNIPVQKKPAAGKTQQYSQEMDLVPGQKIVVSHNQNSTKPIVSVILADGTKYSVKVKTIDENTVELRAKDSIHARVVVKPQPADPKGDKLNENTRMLLMGTARMLMMVRRVNITYKGNYTTTLPGFAPGIGAAFGQNNAGGLAPGLAFAFGATGQEFIDKAYDNGWLVRDKSISYTTNYNRSHNVNVQVNLEPFNNFRIDVNSSWNRSYSTTTQIAFNDRTNTYGGSMSMTTISLGSCFEGHSAKRGYASKTFDRFVKNLDVIQARVQAQYANAVYPESMTGEPGKKFNPEVYGGVDKYSADVMIPAFLAAYTGGKASSRPLGVFPKLFAMLPNWTLSYGGLSKLAAFQKVFKSFNINHSYKSQFSMGQYSTYASFHEYMDGLGFISNVQTGNPIPSSMYNINTVSINESFVPLIGISCTMNNNLSARLEYRKTRVLNLSMSAQQIMETTSDDIVVGAGYKVVGLKLFGAKPGTGRNKVSNDLDINLDFSLRNQSALNRNIAKQYTQATSGNRAVKLAFKADYTWSRMLTMSLYYDYQSNFPLVTANAFPTSTHDFGMSLKFSLAR